VSEHDDRRLIERAIEEFIAAYNRGDVAALMDCYANDLVKLRHGADAETKEQTAVRVAEVLRLYSGRLSVRNDEILVSSDLAFTRGSLRIVLTPRGGGSEQIVERRFVELWHRRDGQWKVARAMDNISK
jgi:ketosteroid isomerase-like protein